MDGTATATRRTVRERLPFPLGCAKCGAPSLHCKRASPAGRFTLSRSQAAPPADRDHAQALRFGLRACAPKIGAGRKTKGSALAFGKRAQKEGQQWKRA